MRLLPYFVVSQTDEDVQRFITEYRQALEYKCQVAHFLLDTIDPDFLMLHLYGNDQICHWLWHVIDPSHPRHRKEEAGRLLEVVLDYYRAFDAEVGRLRQRLGEDTSFFIVSDHGFGPVYKAIDLNTWLYEEGYLALKQSPGTQLRRLWWKLGLTPNSISFLTNNWVVKELGKLLRGRLKDANCGAVDRVQQAHNLAQLLLSFNDIDWPRTKAFSPFGFGQIRINVRGVWAQGCVEPGAEYQRIKQEIAGKLRALMDPESGEPLDAVIITKDEVYHGAFFDEAPDIFFVPVNGKYRPKSAGFTSNKAISYFFGMTGIHKMNGILIGQGKLLNRDKRIEGAEITDLFPSILHMMGMAIPEEVDGKVLQQMFTEEFLQKRPIRFIAEAAEPERPAREQPASQEEEEEVIERLRDWAILIENGPAK